MPLRKWFKNRASRKEGDAALKQETFPQYQRPNGVPSMDPRLTNPVTQHPHGSLTPTLGGQRGMPQSHPGHYSYAGHSTPLSPQYRPDHGDRLQWADGPNQGLRGNVSPLSSDHGRTPPPQYIPTFQVQPPEDDGYNQTGIHRPVPTPQSDAIEVDLEGLSPAQILFVLAALNRSALSVAGADAQQNSGFVYELPNSDAYDVSSISDISSIRSELDDTYALSDGEDTRHGFDEEANGAVQDGPVLERDLNRRCRFMSNDERPHWYILDPLNLPPGHPDFMCGTCRHVDFISLFEQEETNVLPPSKHYIALGTFMDMSQKKECPFCSFASRVIVHHILSDLKLHRADLDTRRQALLGSDLFHESFYVCPIRYASTYHVPLLYFCSESDLPKNSRRRSIATKEVRYGLPRTMAFRPMHKTQSRLGRFTPKDTIDFQWIKERMVLCDERSHSRSYAHTTSVRVIDVNTFSINVLPKGARYCILSYVWGTANQFTLSKENVRGLQKKGSLRKVMGRIPKTIQDTITLVQNIGERYLWVDALCIVQNDNADKAIQIAAMGDIYRQSVLCIQAMCGIDATYGLPGVRPGTRDIQQFATRLPCSRGNLLLSNKLPNADKNATWTTRAWTLQEKVLSQRMLLITDDSVTWWCWHTETVEDENCRHEMWPKGTEHTEMYFFTTEHDLVMSKIPKNCNFDIYAFTVFDYTLRNITKEDDAERACQGVMDVFASLHRGTCVFGFPDTAWDAAMLWCPIGGAAVRRLDAQGRPMFPSWSWLGWKGAAAYPWLTEREFPLSTKGSPLLWEDPTMKGDGRFFTSLEYRHSTSPLRRLNQDIFEKWSLDPEDPWVYTTDFQEELRWIHPTSQEQYLGGSRAFNYIAGQSHHLRLVTLSAVFVLNTDITPRRENFDYSHPLHIQRIVDPWGFSAGYIYTPDPKLMSERQRFKFSGRQEFIIMSRASINSDPRVGAEQLDVPVTEFPALRARSVPQSQVRVERLHDSAYFNLDRYDSSYPWCMFNVLMIERYGDVAQRVSVGRIHIGAFLSITPQRKNITLV